MSQFDGWWRRNPRAATVDGLVVRLAGFPAVLVTLIVVRLLGLSGSSGNTTAVILILLIIGLCFFNIGPLIVDRKSSSRSKKVSRRQDLAFTSAVAVVTLATVTESWLVGTVWLSIAVAGGEVLLAACVGLLWPRVPQH
jgi:hypothetical protein